MAQRQPARRRTQSSATPVSIPDKLYFRIGDVSRLCSLPAYVLRFWESEFPQLKPNKGGTGQRLYRKRDVEMVLHIKRLLYDEGFTIAGARRLLTDKRRPSDTQVVPAREQAARHGTPAGKRSISPVEPVRATGRGPASVSARPGIQELREEMRSLLALLGSSPQESKPVESPSRRNTKKMRSGGKILEEPTLF